MFRQKSDLSRNLCFRGGSLISVKNVLEKAQDQSQEELPRRLMESSRRDSLVA